MLEERDIPKVGERIEVNVSNTFVPDWVLGTVVKLYTKHRPWPIRIFEGNRKFMRVYIHEGERYEGEYFNVGVDQEGVGWRPKKPD